MGSAPKPLRRVQSKRNELIDAFMADIKGMGMRILPPPRTGFVVLAIGNQKGGVGKTTTAAFTAKLMGYALGNLHPIERQLIEIQRDVSTLKNPFGYLARAIQDVSRVVWRRDGQLRLQKKKVLVVDLDPQGNQSDMFGVLPQQPDHEDEPGYTIYDALTGERSVKECIIRINDHVHLLPSDDRLGGLSAWLFAQERRAYQEALRKVRQSMAGTDGGEADQAAAKAAVDAVLEKDFEGEAVLMLRRLLEPLRDEYERIIIDLPPSRELLTLAGLAAADEVITICEASELGRRALPKFRHTVEQVRRRWNPELWVAGILVTRFRTSRTRDKEIIENLRETYADGVFEVVVPDTSRLARAVEDNVGVQSQEIHSMYGDVLNELYDRELRARPELMEEGDTE